MRKIFLCSLLSTFLSVTIAQTNCNIKRAYAFYTVSIPGAQMVDEYGNPIPPKPVITRFIYVESSGISIPVIKSVLYNNMPLLFTVIKVKGKTVSAGNKIENNNDFTITAKKGNTLWKLDLQPMAGKPMPETNCKSIIIKSRITNKFCRFYLYNETEFATLPSY